MKNLIKIALYAILLSTLFACDSEDESDEMSINFENESAYTFEDSSLDLNDTLRVKIEAETEKSSDPLIKFSITESINDAKPVTIINNKINTSKYEYIFEKVLSEGFESGDNVHYVFTISNKDGIIKQRKLNILIK